MAAEDTPNGDASATRAGYDQQINAAQEDDREAAFCIGDDDFDADVDTEATFDVVNDPQVRQSAKEDRIQTIREEMKAKEEDKRNEIQRAKERKEEEHNQEMLSIRSEGETHKKIERKKRSKNA